jgi:hypothetical protein
VTTLTTEPAGGEATVSRRAANAPDRFEMVRGLAFAVSVLAVALFALQTSDTVSVPVTYLLVPLVAYPLVQLTHRSYRYSPLDLVYLTVLVGGLGGVLVFSSSYPIGFSDVHIHLRAMAETVVDGRLAITEDYVATSFVALYVVTTALSALGGITPTTVARGLPLVTFVTLTLVFYHVFASRFLTRRETLLATLLFVLNYGVFRFNAEFRTLNLSLVLMLLLLALFVRGIRVTRLSPELLGLYTVLTVGLTAAHFTTTLMYLVLLTVLTASFVVHRRSMHAVTYLLVTALVLFVYVAYVAGSLTGFLLTVQREIAASFLASTVVGESAGGGIAGVTYGRNMFLIEWTTRILFVAAFGLFGLLWVRERDYFTTFVVVSATSLGLLVVVAALTGFLLNPGRVLTFFAIPYAVAFATGLLVVYRVSGPTTSGWVGRIRRTAQSPAARTVTRVVVAVVLVLVLTNTVMKFPVDVIGSPEPIRTPSAVDEEPQMHIDDDELVARAFVQQYFDGEDERQYLYGDPAFGALMGAFYEYRERPTTVTVQVRDEYACDCGFVVVGETDVGHGAPADTAPAEGSRVYDNGAVEVFELERWTEDNYQWRQRLVGSATDSNST